MENPVDRLQLINISGQDALDELERFRAKAKATGLFPILFGDAEQFERIEEGMEEDFSFAETLRASEGVDVPAWFRSRDELELPSSRVDDHDWPDESDEEMGIVTHLDVLSQEPFDEVIIGLLKIASPWEAFAALNWGGWNECPFPHEHCAIHRDWASRYGAEVVSVTGSIVQCVVARPPTDREAALRLAIEQYAYCTDIVDQGTQSIAALAAGLVNARHWYFWWD